MKFNQILYLSTHLWVTEYFIFTYFILTLHFREEYSIYFSLYVYLTVLAIFTFTLQTNEVLINNDDLLIKLASSTLVELK